MYIYGCGDSEYGIWDNGIGHEGVIVYGESYVEAVPADCPLPDMFLIG